MTAPRFSPDLRVEHHGSIVLVRPLTAGARQWLSDNTRGQWFGGALVVEPRYAADLLDGIDADGMTYTVTQMP